MLVLTRKPGQALHLGDDIVIKIVETRGEGIGALQIGDDIVIKVIEARGEGIRIGIEAPRDVKIQRGEVVEALKATTLEAASEGHDGGTLQDAALRLLAS